MRASSASRQASGRSRPSGSPDAAAGSTAPWTRRRPALTTFARVGARVAIRITSLDHSAVPAHLLPRTRDDRSVTRGTGSSKRASAGEYATPDPAGPLVSGGCGCGTSCDRRCRGQWPPRRGVSAARSGSRPRQRPQHRARRPVVHPALLQADLVVHGPEHDPAAITPGLDLMHKTIVRPAQDD